MEVASAFVKFLGNFAPVDEGLAKIPATAEPHAKAAGGMFATHIGNGIKLGVGGLATSGLAGAMLKLSEPLEKSEATLSAAFDQTGHHIDDYKKKIEEAQASGAHYGHGAADVNEALSKLTIGFKDPQKALDEMRAAEELAAMKHISLTEAASTLVKVHAGSTKPLKDFGINIKDSATILADQTKTMKAAEAATVTHQKAVDALAQLEARDAGVKKLSVAQQQQLAAAHKAVTDSAVKLTEATDAKAKAEAAAHGVTKNGEQIFNKLIANYHGAEAQADTFSGKVEGAKTSVENFAAGVGAKAAPALTALGPLMMVSGGLIESGALKMIGSGAKLVASWVADTAKFLVQQAIRLGAWVAANAVMVATAIATGIAAAAAFMLPLLPFILIGLAVAGLVVLVVTHFDQIKAVVTGAVGFVINWVKQNWPLLLTILLGPFGLVVAFIIQHFDQIKKVAAQLIEDIAGFFSKLPGRVLDFFVGLPAQLMQVGKDMIHAIAQGLASAAGNVPVIGGALKSFLQSFEGGGIVAGTGPQLVIAHGGEKILTAAEQRHGGQGKGGDQVIHNHFEAPIDPNAGAFMGREIAWQLKTAT